LDTRVSSSIDDGGPKENHPLAIAVSGRRLPCSLWRDKFAGLTDNSAIAAVGELSPSMLAGDVVGLLAWRAMTLRSPMVVGRTMTEVEPYSSKQH